VSHAPLAHWADEVQANPNSIAQTELQPSLDAVFPSSQPSAPSRTLLPQLLAASQTSGFSVTSHTPLAHWAADEHVCPFSFLQTELQPSLLTKLPSSHPSSPSLTLLPQVLAASQRSGLSVASQIPLAQSLEDAQVWPFSFRQLELQPSPLVVLPSSQPSPSSITLFPQTLLAWHTSEIELHTPLAH
jgi:hypothetical protein